MGREAAGERGSGFEPGVLVELKDVHQLRAEGRVPGFQQPGDAEQGRAGEKGDGEADCYRQESSDDEKDDAG